MRTLLCVVLLAACGEPKQERNTRAIENDKNVAMTSRARVEVTTKSQAARAEYEAGHTLFMNQRRPEAVPHYTKAIELDPSFALATAELGLSTPGPAGLALIKKAKELAVTEGEKTWIAAHEAMRNGDDTQAIALLEKVTELAPGQWEAHHQASVRTLANGDVSKAIRHAEQILVVEPDNAIAYNDLAYAYAAQRQFDKAIGAAAKQAALQPNEPNSHDTVGEMQLLAGKFADAEQSFLAATKLDPSFDPSWNGAALARAYRGNYAGAYEAYERQAASPRPDAKLEAMLDTAWIQAAENKLPAALATFDALDKIAAGSTLFAYSALDRAHLLAYAGKYADAATWYELAQQRAHSLPFAARDEVDRRARVGLVRMQAVRGQATSQTDGAGGSAHLRGLVAWATSGPKAAITELAKCARDDVRCRYDLVTAARKAGDEETAKTVSAELADTPVRIPEGVYFKTHLPN